jgi:hypothetical protein
MLLLVTYPSFHEVCKNNIYNRYCQYFLFLYTSSNVNVYHKIYNESITMKLYKKYPIYNDIFNFVKENKLYNYADDNTLSHSGPDLN